MIAAIALAGYLINHGPDQNLRVVAICRDGYQVRQDITKPPMRVTCAHHYGIGFMTGVRG